MRMNSRIWSCGAGGGAFAALAAAAFGGSSTTFEPLADHPDGRLASRAWDVSADGSVIVGRFKLGDELGAAMWVNGSPVGLGDLSAGMEMSTAHCVSDDGNVIAGIGHNGAAWEAFRWQSNVMTPLGLLSGYSWLSTVNGMSADGNVLVGHGYATTPPITDAAALVWEDGDPVSELLDFPDGVQGASAQGVVDLDGDYIVVGLGRTVASLTQQACYWDSSGTRVQLTNLPGDGSPHSAVIEGTEVGGELILVGYSSSGAVNGTNRSEACRWINGVPQSLGDLPGGIANANSYDIDASGRTVVGIGTTAIGNEAFIWRESMGIQNLRTWLEATYGIDLTGWVLQNATGVSADGMTLVGYGIDPMGDERAWVVRFASCPADFDGDGVVGSADLSQLIGQWGAMDDVTDLDGDGTTGSSDLAILLGSWGSCP